ncbi:hypothetical protein B0H63DRAFT_564113 [Podospora didyma]|uniref:Uncharacterized protein n=1 Tax=Podospora didyma TaxID=330526 RepID=A0AAE0K5J8_9PEZI|nr:hypothetical protein B0H63DRAFT_564113 [Podospora didyma]
MLGRESTRQSVWLFDSCALWGHHEADLRFTRQNGWDLENAGETYRKTMGVSEPQEDFGAQIEVYATLGFALRLAMHPDELRRRLM